MSRSRILCVPILAAAFLPAACRSTAGRIDVAAGQEKDVAAEEEKTASPWKGVTQLIAVIGPTKGNEVRGTIVFTDAGDKVKVEAMVAGLEPNQKHAMHVHEWGDIRAEDGTATGGHYNPEMHEHGLPEKEHRHAGDLGNLEADAEGNAKYTLVVDNLSLVGSHNPIVGRAVIIHAKVDDGGQPTGNAGARIGQGVIGIVKHEK